MLRSSSPLGKHFHTCDHGVLCTFKRPVQVTHLDRLVATPCNEQDVLTHRLGRTFSGGGQECHAVHITIVSRVYDILRRDMELRAGSREYDMAIHGPDGGANAITGFQVRGPSLGSRVAVKEFVRASWGACARGCRSFNVHVEVGEIVPLNGGILAPDVYRGMCWRPGEREKVA